VGIESRVVSIRVFPRRKRKGHLGARGKNRTLTTSVLSRPPKEVENNDCPRENVVI